jgi:hypothetical protein
LVNPIRRSTAQGIKRGAKERKETEAMKNNATEINKVILIPIKAVFINLLMFVILIKIIKKPPE